MPSADQVPGHKPAFDNALAQVGCPDRRIGPALHYVLFALPTFTSRRMSARSRLRRKRDGLLVTLALGHHGPGHPRNLVASAMAADLGRAPPQQRREPGPMLGAVDLGVADDGECSGHEQAA